MSHDIIIRGGQIVDGSGSEAYHGDVGIRDGQISEIGKVDGSATREIDARGALVTPGFIDVHTHFDAQIGWDPLMTPLSWRGVTTALMGNCGVTFAPCRPADRPACPRTSSCAVSSSSRSRPGRGVCAVARWRFG